VDQITHAVTRLGELRAYPPCLALGQRGDILRLLGSDVLQLRLWRSRSQALGGKCWEQNCQACSERSEALSSARSRTRPFCGLEELQTAGWFSDAKTSRERRDEGLPYEP
jgi:hypothetical protein